MWNRLQDSTKKYKKVFEETQNSILLNALTNVEQTLLAYNALTVTTVDVKVM